MNRNYLRGRQKEYELKDRLEKQGYIVFRTSGSHGVVDLIAVKPDTSKGDADLFPEIQFIQIKSSIHFKKERMVEKFIDHLLVHWYQFPIKSKEWYAKYGKSSKTRMAGRKSKRG